MSPASRASSISLVNSPLPPASGARSWIMSPEVRMVRMAIRASSMAWARAGRARTSRACASASGVPRVPIVATMSGTGRLHVNFLQSGAFTTVARYGYFVLGAVHAVLFWVSISVFAPVLLVGLLNTRKRLLHDIVLGTVVISRSARIAPIPRPARLDEFETR